VLEVEDVHWMDANSETWLSACVQQVASTPLLLLVTFRPGYHPLWMDKVTVTQMALLPLDVQNSRTVLQDALAHAVVDETMLHTLLQKAEGNPFFLEEFARAVVEDASQPARALPDTVQAVLAARIDRLPPAAKHLLHIAAVLGKDAPLALLRACTDLSDAALHHSFVHLQAAEFLYETLQANTSLYTFKHVLTQEVAYQSLLQHTRQHYHRRIAQVLVTQFPDTVARQPALVAHHYTAAGLTAEAIPYWQQAGQQALARSANVEAITHLRHGLALLRTLPETSESAQQELELQLALGPALMATKGDGATEVHHTYERARVLCQRTAATPRLFPVLFGLWVFYFIRVEYQTALALGKQLFTLAQNSQDPEHLLQAHHALGCVYHHLGDLTRSRAHLEQDASRCPPQSHHSRALLYGLDARSGSLVYDALPLWSLGYPDQAMRHCSQALAWARELAHPYSLVFVQSLTAVFHSLRGEAEAVQHHAAAAIELATAQEFMYWLAQATILHGWALVKQGYAAGIPQMQQGLTARQATEAQVALPYNLALIADAYQHVSRVQEGWDALAEAFSVAAHTGERWWEAELHRLKGTFLQQQGPLQWQEAAQYFQQALTIARSQQAKSLELRAAISLARLGSQQGKRTDAYQTLAEIYSWFTEGFDTPDLQEAAALLQALAG
jgi:predicted ATPase